MIRVLIVGCGQLGSRHLQAVASLPQVDEIEVVDPRPEALEMGRQRLGEVLGQHARIRTRWLASFDDARPDGALCIVATQAQGRCQLVRAITERLRYSTFLLEKIVGQSISEVEELLEFTEGRRLSVFVNFKGRCSPFYQRVKRLLRPDDPMLFSVVGGNHGLANNGIHAADLFAFYDGATHIELAGARIDPVLHRTKRGTLDLSGTLQGYTRKGSHFTISYAADHDRSEQIAITTRSYRCIVDNLARWAVESHARTRWTWQPVPFEGNLAVSEMTKQFAADLIRDGRCELPTLAESLVAHRFILETLKPHFSHLLNEELVLCPVT